MNKVYRIAQQELSTSIVHRSPEEIDVLHNGESATLQCDCSGRQLILQGERKRYRTLAARQKDRIYVWFDGRIFDLQEIEESAVGQGASGSQNEIRSPMPGTIIKLNAKSGQEVEADQIVAVLEAMKMEHNLRAPRAGKIAKVNVAAGQTVSSDALLISLESNE